MKSLCWRQGMKLWQYFGTAQKNILGVRFPAMLLSAGSYCRDSWSMCVRAGWYGASTDTSWYETRVSLGSVCAAHHQTVQRINQSAELIWNKTPWMKVMCMQCPQQQFCSPDLSLSFFWWREAFLLMLFSEPLIQFPHFCLSVIITTKSRWEQCYFEYPDDVWKKIMLFSKGKAGCLQGRFSSLNFSDDNFE